MPVSRTDLHVHSTASQRSRLGLQTALGLPECATPPEEVYELAKRRGMDFVTITDHDTISGALEIADLDDAFVSEELTAWFKGEPQAVHVLCWGITPDDHDWLQSASGDVEACAEYLHGNGIACALAHPFYAVAAPLRASHRRRLARLFPVWETRNGSRSAELNAPAAIYIETHGGTGVAGSDDHAGVDIGRTWTETPPAGSPEGFLRRIRSGQAAARGDQGSAAKWAHAAMAIAVRALGQAGAPHELNPSVVLSMAERAMSQGDARSGPLPADLSPADARALLHGWMEALGLELSEHGLIARLQAADFSHAELFRSARRVHEARLRAASAAIAAAASAGEGYGEASRALFAACVPAIPYAPAVSFLAREKAKLAALAGGARRVALVADGLGAVHGVTRTLDQVRERGVPGFEVEVIGTDACVDRRLPAVAEVEMPFYAGLCLGVPSLPAVVEAIAEGRYDLMHICSPGPAGVAAALIARIMGVPVVGSYHTELGVYAELRSGDALLRAGMDAALAAFYGHCEVVLSPSKSADESLAALGIEPGRVRRWSRGVDAGCFSPSLRDPRALPGELPVLYAGRLAREKGVELLADAFCAAHERDPRLHLVLAGGGPEEGFLRERLGERASFLGWLEGEELARAYASAEIFLFCSRTDTFGQVVLEAQASGLPVVAVGEGGPATLVEHGRTGRLCPAEPRALAEAICRLAASPGERRRLAGAALAGVRERTWESSLLQLAGGYAAAGRPASSDRRAGLSAGAGPAGAQAAS
jgi:glycosyltransferase involved in cell wall biosynthesis/predicted metal-dependent phosphoesterase TrpH